VTSGTLFSFHKMPLRNYLAVTAIFCNEVMASELKGMQIGGDGETVEVDCLFRRLPEAGQPQGEPARPAVGEESERHASGCGGRPRTRRPHPTGRVKEQVVRPVLHHRSGRADHSPDGRRSGVLDDLEARYATGWIDHGQLY
jgi:hypothetical protein